MVRRGFLEWWRYWNLADHGIDALAEYARSGRLSPEWRVPIEKARKFLVDALQGKRIVDTMRFEGYRRGVLEACEWAHDTIKVLHREEHVVEVLEAEIHRYLALLDLLLVPEKPALSRKDADALTAFFKTLQQVAMARQERERQEHDAERNPFGHRYRAYAAA